MKEAPKEAKRLLAQTVVAAQAIDEALNGDDVCMENRKVAFAIISKSLESPDGPSVIEVRGIPGEELLSLFESLVREIRKQQVATTPKIP